MLFLIMGNMLSHALWKMCYDSWPHQCQEWESVKKWDTLDVTILCRLEIYERSELSAYNVYMLSAQNGQSHVCTNKCKQPYVYAHMTPGNHIPCTDNDSIK